jgi:hypothetical protein
MVGIVGLTFFLGMTLLTSSIALVAGLVLLAICIHAAYLVLSGFVNDED